MRSGPFNKFFTKVLGALVIGLLFIIIGGQLYRYINDRHDTKEAVLCSINENISFEGVIIRDETVIPYTGYSSSDIISYNYADGSKVSKGDKLAQIFSTPEEASASSRLAKTEAKIEMLKRAQNPGTTDYVQPESISRRIDENYKQLIALANENRFVGFEEQKNDMTLVMNIFNIISGLSANYNVKISELETEAVKLRQQVSSAKGEKLADRTGYFVSYCDGYEDILNKKKALSLTEEDINTIIAEAATKRRDVPKSSIGKMFSDYSAYIVGVIDHDPRVTVDSRLKLSSDSSDTLYDVTVVSCRDMNDGKSVAVFSCDILDSAIASSRIHSMQLIFDEYSGIKVPRSAIRFLGEDKGVYVILGEDITFKKIDVIYEGSDFVISRNTSDDDSLRLYDQILLEVVKEEDVRAFREKQEQLEGVSGGEEESDGDPSEDSGSEE